MINAIVACSVVLTLAALYYLARNSTPRRLRHSLAHRLQRLGTLAIKRAARRHEQWLTARELERRP
jgi:hypothetical protein